MKNKQTKRVKRTFINCCSKRDKERLKGLLYQILHKAIKLDYLIDTEINPTLRTTELEIYFSINKGDDNESSK